MSWCFYDEKMASIYWTRLEENIEIFVKKIVRFELDCREFSMENVNIDKMMKYFEVIDSLKQIVSRHTCPPASFDPSVTVENSVHVPCVFPHFRFFDKETVKKELFPNGYKFENIHHGYMISNLLLVIEQLRRELNFIFSTGCCTDLPTGPGDLPPLNFLTENSAINHFYQQFPADFLLYEKDGRLIIPVNLFI
jgi:hypothetical protein